MVACPLHITADPAKPPSAQLRPRPTCPLNRALFTDLPTLGSARPGAGLHCVFGVFSVTGFAGILSAVRGRWCSSHPIAHHAESGKGSGKA